MTGVQTCALPIWGTQPKAGSFLWDGRGGHGGGKNGWKIEDAHEFAPPVNSVKAVLGQWKTGSLC